MSRKGKINITVREPPQNTEKGAKNVSSMGKNFSKQSHAEGYLHCGRP